MLSGGLNMKHDTNQSVFVEYAFSAWFQINLLSILIFSFLKDIDSFNKTKRTGGWEQAGRSCG